MSASENRERFYHQLRGQNLAPLWSVLSRLVPGEPKAGARPYCWKWSEVYPRLLESGGVISAEEAERRVLVLVNPGLPETSLVTDTLYGGLQMILPGETAPIHRHTQSALRFVLHGEGAYTAVDGAKARMSRGDFIITPRWFWHDHGHDGSEPVIWLDGLDVPLVSFLNAGFREGADLAPEPASWGETVSTSPLEAAMLPVRSARNTQGSPLFSYPYERSREALRTYARTQAPDPYLGHCLRYVNPMTGDWAMPTLGTTLRGFPKGFASRQYKSTESLVLVGVEGQLSIRADSGEQMSVGPNDVAAIPSWCGWRVTAEQESVCFGYSDRPVHEKLGLLRERRD